MYISNKVIYDKDMNLRGLEVSILLKGSDVKLSKFSDSNLKSIIREFLANETLINKEEQQEKIEECYE